MLFVYWKVAFCFHYGFLGEFLFYLGFNLLTLSLEWLVYAFHFMLKEPFKNENNI